MMLSYDAFRRKTFVKLCTYKVLQLMNWYMTRTDSNISMLNYSYRKKEVKNNVTKQQKLFAFLKDFISIQKSETSTHH